MKVLTLFAIPALQDAPIDAPQFDSGVSLLWMLVQTVLVLVFVCALAYLVLRYIPRRAGLSTDSTLIRVVDRVPLDQRRNLYVVRVVGRWLLVASSEAGVQLITELDAEAASLEAESLERHRLGTLGGKARTMFSERLSELMRKKK